jgi:tRNA threonylcarbamoyladenosine modification (KEOPS) complex Cgi121 subunit
MLFSSEKGNFSSGDDTEGNLTKQYESVKYIHKDVESQMKRLAQILIIDALGVDDDIIRALPYTEIHFDTPVIANSVERAEIGKNIADTFFQYVAGQMPVDKAASLASASGGDDLSINSELLDDLKRRQKESDDFIKEKQEKELELLDTQIKTAREGTVSSAAPSVTKSEGYSKLEQEKHEKTKMPGEKRSQQLKKSQGKIKP